MGAMLKMAALPFNAREMKWPLKVIDGRQWVADEGERGSKTTTTTRLFRIMHATNTLNASDILHWVTR